MPKRNAAAPHECAAGHSPKNEAPPDASSKKEASATTNPPEQRNGRIQAIGETSADCPAPLKLAEDGTSFVYQELRCNLAIKQSVGFIIVVVVGCLLLWSGLWQVCQQYEKRSVGMISLPDTYTEEPEPGSLRGMLGGLRQTRKECVKYRSASTAESVIPFVLVVAMCFLWISLSRDVDVCFYDKKKTMTVRSCQGLFGYLRSVTAVIPYRRLRDVRPIDTMLEEGPKSKRLRVLGMAVGVAGSDDGEEPQAHFPVAYFRMECHKLRAGEEVKDELLKPHVDAWNSFLAAKRKLRA